MRLLGDISAVLTFISFIIFCIGKLIKIKTSLKFRYEDIGVYYGDIEGYQYSIIEEYDIGHNNDEKLIISSDVPLNWIKIYECYYDGDLNELMEKEIILTHDFLNISKAIQINTYLSCGIPTYKLKFERCDYIIGEFYFAENLKNGALSEMVELKHSFKSYLYYFFE